MRTFLIAVMLVLLSQPAWSDARVIDSTKLDSSNFSVNVICVDGHKFVAANRIRWRSPQGYNRLALGQTREWVSDLSMVQMYEERNGKALPAKC